MSEWQLFRERAEQAQAEADAAVLENVRERCLRSAAAWAAMADRGEGSDKMRIARESAKAAATATG